MSRRAKIRWISYAAALAVIVSAALAACHVGAGGYISRLDAQSDRFFGEAFSAVERLDRSLRKCEFVSGRKMETILCQQIYSDAQSVETALSMLPVQMDALENISKEISVMGDYAFSISGSSAEGADFSESVLQRFADFSAVTSDLAEQLEVLRQAYKEHSLVHENRLRLTDSLSNLEDQAASKTETLDHAFHRIQGKLSFSTPFSYDGKFSDREETFAGSLKSEEAVNQSQAIQAAAAFLNTEPDNLQKLDSSEGEIPCWRFSVQGPKKGVISVTVNGGKVIRYLADQTVPAGDYDRMDCVEACRSFLQSQGYLNMAEDETAADTKDSAICFVAEENGVLCLPDRIVLRVDPSSGDIISFQAEDYLKNHHERQLSDMNMESLRSALPGNAVVQDERSVLMLSPGGNECLCAEFQCRMPDGESARVYVNAETGEQQAILLKNETETSMY